MQELRSVLEKHGFHFKKQFGQNFISDTNLLKSIVDASGITKDTTVVEIGCGAGTLTRALAEAAKKVYAFDIDRDLQPVLAETLVGLDNVEVIFRDFNKLDLKEFEKEIEEYTVPTCLIISRHRLSLNYWKKATKYKVCRVWCRKKWRIDFARKKIRLNTALSRRRLP